MHCLAAWENLFFFIKVEIVFSLLEIDFVFSSSETAVAPSASK
jgi:hypothetical protein